MQKDISYDNRNNVILMDSEGNEIGTEEKLKVHQECLLHLAFSIFIPALKVISIVEFVFKFFNFVLTNAPPLPGLTCWNSIT